MERKEYFTDRPYKKMKRTHINRIYIQVVMVTRFFQDIFPQALYKIINGTDVYIETINISSFLPKGI